MTNILKNDILQTVIYEYKYHFCQRQKHHFVVDETSFTARCTSRLQSRHFTQCVSIVLNGGVAQLGERLTGSQEVMGSIPTVSTRKNHFFGSGFFNEIRLSASEITS